jgi:hypothetical protein
MDGRRNDALFEDFTFRLIWKIADEKGLQGKNGPQDVEEWRAKLSIQDIDVPEELQPLAYRSRKLLTTKLRRDNELHRWIKSYTRWPPGLALLLQSEHASIDGALTAACEANCEESVRLLINDHRCSIGKEHLEFASFHPTPGISDLIVNSLIDRRKRLQALAAVHLPREVIGRMNIRSDTLLNVHAYEAYTLLSAVSVDLKNLLECQTWSVFDSFGVNFELADRLYEAGFRDLNENHKTCLTNLWRATPPCTLEIFLQKAHWLISKGANVYHQGPAGSALHILGGGVGSVLYWNNKDPDFHLESQSLSDSSKALLRMILLDNIRDDCQCACSLKGCSPLTAFLGGLFSSRINGDSKGLIKILADLLAIVFNEFDAVSLECYKNHLSSGILRFITFRSLELTHTCLHEYRRIEPEEIKEIHDEEKLMILDLMSLSKQFSEEFEKHNLQLPSFIIGSWQTHMDSFLSSSGTQSPQELSQILETGVTIDQPMFSR